MVDALDAFHRLLMVHVIVEVQVGAWLMHLFMVQVDVQVVMVHVTCYWYIQVVWCRLIGTGLQQYISQ
jgi:hypothetical protein